VFHPLSGANKTPKAAPTAKPAKTPSKTFPELIVVFINWLLKQSKIKKLFFD
jgi:hypothetical protein